MGGPGSGRRKGSSNRKATLGKMRGLTYKGRGTVEEHMKIVKKRVAGAKHYLKGPTGK